MVLTLELDAETRARLEAGARARGVSLETFVRAVVDQAARTGNALTESAEHRKGAVRSMMEFTRDYHFTLGEGSRIKDLRHEGHRY